ncbi:MAG: hypothetical protein JSW11_01600 [Candidatus Heimdallarchaeota archaeon]|nr:MAG: hypothetical protein JSW11_01600 [Candidatus Heimdallarchaeota archaeon]
MIAAFSSRQLFIVVTFSIAAIFEIFCSFMVLKRDPHYQGNRFTSIAYLGLTIGLIISAMYVIITDRGLVEILQRFINLFNIITVILLFLSAMYISEGDESLRSYRMIIIVVDLFFGLLLIVLPGVTVFPKDIAVPEGEQLIEWSTPYFIGAIVPLYLTLCLTCYYYGKVWRDIPSESPIKRACFLIMIGTAILGLGHFLLVIPLVFRRAIDEIILLGFTSIGSVGILISSLLIFLGYRTRISEMSILSEV